MFHAVFGMLTAVCVVYLYGRCIHVLRMPALLRAIFFVLLCAAAFKLQIFRLLHPGAVVPEMPRAALIAAGGLHMLTVVWVLLSLLLDGALAAYGAARHVLPATPPLRRMPGLRVGILFAAACLLTTLGVQQAIRVPEVRRVALSVPALPSALEGLRIVQLSDLHVSVLYRRAWVSEIVARANVLRPDLLVLTGDMVDGSPAHLAADIAPLADLRARYGVFACMGNHEYYWGAKPWRRALEGLGVRVLCNSGATLSVGDVALALGGVADPAGEGRPNAEGPDIVKTFADAPVDGWRLLLAHRPILAARAAAEGVKAQLSGHTHGGQIFPFHLPTAWYNGGWLHGAYTVGEMVLYVSRGAGLWPGLPIRLGAPAEITELVLRRAPEGSAVGADRR